MALACCVAPACIVAPAAAQTEPWTSSTGKVWQSAIVDLYQHQRWGKTEAGGENDSDWEAKVKVTSGVVSFDPASPGGWCRVAAFCTSFLYWNTQGYTGLQPSGNTNPTWLASANTAMKDFAIFSFRPDKPAAERQPKAWLKSQGHGEEKGVSKRTDFPKKGLIFTEYFRDGIVLKYRSSDGTERKANPTVGPPAKLVDFMAAEFRRGNSVSLYLTRISGGSYSTLLWWSQYHNVSLGGYDSSNGWTLYFADPDSNKGNGDANAGWRSKTRPDTAISDRKYIPWDGSKDPVPVAIPGAGDPPADPTNLASVYFTAKMSPNTRLIDENVAANARFKNVALDRIEVISPVPAAPKATPPAAKQTDLPGVFTFDVTAGPVGSIDDLWIIPTRGVDASFPASFVVDDPAYGGGVWTVQVIGDGVPYEDPMGNTRTHGLVRITLASGQPLGNVVGTLTFRMAQSWVPMTDGYDVLFRAPPSRSDVHAPTLYLVRAFGDAVVTNAPFEQDTISSACAADLDEDGVVDGADLGILLAKWGNSDPYPADLDGNGVVDGADLGLLLAAWGPCP
ncbi:MAG: GC-type dockerin domain-anchored protein [Phycisphaerales bacterium]